jgi:hypothetical protein
VVTIDANRTPEEVWRKVEEELRARMPTAEGRRQ